MKVYNLDMVVRGLLLDKRYSLHWYVDFLGYAVDCVRDLNIYHVGCVNSKLLPVSKHLTVTLPCDYVDYIRVGIVNGAYVKPLVRGITLSRLYNYDTEGKKLPYDDINDVYLGTWTTMWYENYLNEYGERLGRMFNYEQNEDTFEVFKERNEIQLNPAMDNVKNIVLDYISDGIDVDAATYIDPSHFAYIKAYGDWKHKLHNRQYSLGEREEAKRLVDAELRKVRAVADPLTVEDVRRSFRRNNTATYK